MVSKPQGSDDHIRGSDSRGLWEALVSPLPSSILRPCPRGLTYHSCFCLDDNTNTQCPGKASLNVLSVLSLPTDFMDLNFAIVLCKGQELFSCDLMFKITDGNIVLWRGGFLLIELMYT